tara:strand:+ start:118 stop:654 length:537 start_codon:yes stop_codon:yes gene_type:complete
LGALGGLGKGLDGLEAGASTGEEALETVVVVSAVVVLVVFAVAFGAAAVSRGISTGTASPASVGPDIVRLATKDLDALGLDALDDETPGRSGDGDGGPSLRAGLTAVLDWGDFLDFSLLTSFVGGLEEDTTAALEPPLAGASVLCFSLPDDALVGDRDGDRRFSTRSFVGTVGGSFDL